MVTLLQLNSWIIDHVVDNYLLHFVWFPLVFSVGIIVKLITPDSVLDQWRNGTLVNENNILNKIFGVHCFEIYSIVYIMTLFGKILKDFLHSKYQTILPSTAITRNDFKSKSRRAILVVRGFAFRYITTFILITLIYYLRVLVLHHTSTDDNNGFNFSGHFFTLVAFSLSLLWEFHNSISTSELFDLEDFSSTDSKTKFIYLCYTIILDTTLILIVIWSGILLVTSVFYHTLLEKLLGLLIGYFIPVIVYLLLNRLSFIN